MPENTAPSPIGGLHAGFLQIYRDLGPGQWLLLASFIAALVYGVYFFRRPASPPRTGVKTAGVGLLVGACLLGTAPWTLLAGLTFSSVGDAFLATESERRLRLGMASFFIAHLCYIALFVLHGHDAAGPHGWPLDHLPLSRIGEIAAVGVLAAGMLAWLWPKLGAMRIPVSLYVTVIFAMVATSLTLPPNYGAPMIGAVLFFASDAILAAQLFRGRFEGWVGGFLVWWLYYFAQVAIMLDFAGKPTF